MRSIKTIIAALAVALLLSTGAFAGAEPNEVGALLVYPVIWAAPGSGSADADSMGGSETLWGRLLYQSVTTGDDVQLILEGPPVGLE